MRKIKHSNEPCRSTWWYTRSARCFHQITNSSRVPRGRSKNNAGGLMSSMAQALIHLSLWVTQIWRPEANTNICLWVVLLMREFVTWGTHKDEFNICLETRNAEIAKSPKIGNVNVVNPHKSCFRANAHLVFDWCLNNKDQYFTASGTWYLRTILKA